MNLMTLAAVWAVVTVAAGAISNNKGNGWGNGIGMGLLLGVFGVLVVAIQPRRPRPSTVLPPMPAPWEPGLISRVFRRGVGR